VHPCGFFLTKSHDMHHAGETAGAVTTLISRLLGRCVDETDDKDVRDALATCLGEIGAIDPNRLDKNISSLHFGSDLPGSDDGGHFILSNPPWKTSTENFEFHVLTRHLVNALRSAPSTLDQVSVKLTPSSFCPPYCIHFSLSSTLRSTRSLFRSKSF